MDQQAMQIGWQRLEVNGTPIIDRDPDFLFTELCDRLEQSSPSSSAGVEAELDSLAKEKDYWHNRCFQAEAFIDASPFDPGMTPEQIEAYRIWLESKKR